jgi:serine acetyltransferase
MTFTVDVDSTVLVLLCWYRNCLVLIPSKAVLKHAEIYANSNYLAALRDPPLDRSSRAAYIPDIDVRRHEKEISRQPHIGASLIRDLGTGNIPIMHCNAGNNQVMYHDVVVGRYGEGREDITPLVDRNLAAIAAMTSEALVGIV